MKRILTFLFLLASIPMFAADTVAPSATTLIPQPKDGKDLFLLVLVGTMFLVCTIIAIMALNVASQLKQLLTPKSEVTNSAYEEAMANRTFWQKLWSLKPIAFEKDMMLEHQYDGIAELDNPTPPWFMYLFYSTIVFGVIYLFVYHIAGDGQIMKNEYNEEVTIAEKAREAYMKKFANSVNENNVVALKDAKGLDEGKKLYTQNCVACHGQEAEGKVGPNLTDEYWIHGGDIKKVFHTLTEGVPEKGMISWKKSLNPIQIQQVASFVLSLKGTNPANAKEPQGDKE